MRSLEGTTTCGNFEELALEPPKKPPETAPFLKRSFPKTQRQNRALHERTEEVRARQLRAKAGVGPYQSEGPIAKKDKKERYTTGARYQLLLRQTAAVATKSSVFFSTFRM